MWIFTRGSFVALSQDKDDESLILVRARREEDILRLFPGNEVEQSPGWGYPFHASIPRDTVALRVANHIQDVDYPDFTSCVPEPGRREAYKSVSNLMAKWGGQQGDSEGMQPPGGFGPLEHAAHPPRTAWGPLRAAVGVLVAHLEAWEGETLPARKKDLADTIDVDLHKLGFVPDGIHYLQMTPPLPTATEVQTLNLDQSLRLLGLLQRLAKWVQDESGFSPYLESGLAPALIRHIELLVNQVEGA